MFLKGPSNSDSCLSNGGSLKASPQYSVKYCIASAAELTKKVRKQASGAASSLSWLE